MNKFIAGMCTAVEIGCILGLGVIALKRNNDCYKATCKLINEQIDNIRLDIDCAIKDAEIKKLKEELSKFKKEEEA